MAQFPRSDGELCEWLIRAVSGKDLRLIPPDAVEVLLSKHLMQPKNTFEFELTEEGATYVEMHDQSAWAAKRGATVPTRHGH